MSSIVEIMRTAKAAGASDVHITVGIQPKMRVNGSLMTMNYSKMLPADTLEILLEIMTETQRARFEEQGEYDISFSIPELGRYRVSAYKQNGCVALAFRLIGTQIPSPKVLGVPESVMNLYRKKRGLILVAGSAGSGRSTTLAAILDKINNTRDAHIITLESPIEYLHKHKAAMVNQREIGLDSQSYTNALRAALHEDPDVIMVSEMHDVETISAVIAAAETGHLVLSTMDAVGAAGAVYSVVDAFPFHRQQSVCIRLANVLEAVVSQQLVPTMDAGGCAAAFEVMHANKEIRSLIREGKFSKLTTVMQTNHEMGMITMDESLLQLFCEGKIDRDVAVQFAEDPDEMQNLCSFS